MELKEKCTMMQLSTFTGMIWRGPATSLRVLLLGGLIAEPLPFFQHFSLHASRAPDRMSTVSDVKME